MELKSVCQGTNPPSSQIVDHLNKAPIKIQYPHPCLLGLVGDRQQEHRLFQFQQEMYIGRRGQGVLKPSRKQSRCGCDRVKDIERATMSTTVNNVWNLLFQVFLKCNSYSFRLIFFPIFCIITKLSIYAGNFKLLLPGSHALRNNCLLNLITPFCKSKLFYLQRDILNAENYGIITLQIMYFALPLN